MTWNKWLLSGNDISYRTVSHGTLVYGWFGHSFNPSGTDQGCPYEYIDESDELDWVDGLPCAAPDDEATSFDLTNHQTGVEIIVSTFFLEAYEESGTKSGYLRMYDNDANVINSVAYSLTGSGVGYWTQAYAWAAVGVRSSEIDTNGTWNAVGLTGDYSDTISCTFSNLSTTDVTTAVDSGYMWIEGDDIWITNRAGRAMRLPNDGSTYGTASTGSEGHVWILSDGTRRLYYVDDDLDIRRTKLGAIVYWHTDIELSNVGTTNAGHVWIDSGQDHYLYCVASDGQIFRIGAGHISEDNQ